MSRKLILVVEDHKSIRDFLFSRLGGDYDLTFAESQEDALNLLRSASFDLVLLDLLLPRARGEMDQNIQVGIDILNKIRLRQILRRESLMPLPVIVMTAHGSETMSTDVLIGSGANDYIPKPFGEGRELEEKIERALLGAAKLMPVGSAAASIVQIAFSPDDSVVLLHEILYRRDKTPVIVELLVALREQFQSDSCAFKMPMRFSGIRGDKLAKRFGIKEHALRKRVEKFRDDTKRDFKEKLGRTIGDDDIIENVRQRGIGYRLNPVTVRIVTWEDATASDD